MSHRGTVIAEPRWGDPNFVVGLYNPLLRALESEGWKLIYLPMDQPLESILPELAGDRILLFKVPQHSHTPDIRVIPRQYRVILWLADVDTGRTNDPWQERGGVYARAMEYAAQRADAVLSYYMSPWHRLWSPRFAGIPTAFLPHWFSPERYFRAASQAKEIRKIASTTAPGTIYQMRHIAERRTDLFDVSKHPGYRGNDRIVARGEVRTGDQWAYWIGRHFAALADATDREYLVYKYFEICAAGTLLLASEIPDGKARGFLPWVNYLPVSPSTLVDVAQDVYAHPEKYNQIRERGQRMVLERQKQEDPIKLLCNLARSI